MTDPTVGPSSEIGEELRADQLEPETVYVLQAIHRPDHAITVWFAEFRLGHARFEMGEIRTTMFLRVENNKLFDSMNHQIRVFRYLGEV